MVLEATYLTLATNVVAAAIGEPSTWGQIAAVRTLDLIPLSPCVFIWLLATAIDLTIHVDMRFEWPISGDCLDLWPFEHRCIIQPIHRDRI